jgi:hypothetical protein
MIPIFTTSLDPKYIGAFQMYAGNIYSFSGGVITNLNTDADYDFTGHTCTANVREKTPNGTLILELNTADGSIVLEDGQIKVPDFTLPDGGDFLADFVVTLPDGQELTFMQARFLVIEKT